MFLHILASLVERMRIYSCVKQILVRQNNGILFFSELKVIITHGLYEAVCITHLL